MVVKVNLKGCRGQTFILHLCCFQSEIVVSSLIGSARVISQTQDEGEILQKNSEMRGPRSYSGNSLEGLLYK